MKDQFNVEAVGTLKSVEKWQSKKGLIYTKGFLSCMDPEIEIPFSSFNEGFNEVLFNDKLKSERIRISGRATEWNDGINIILSQLVRAGSGEVDDADFIIIGTLREFKEDGNVLFVTIETKQRQGNKDMLRSIDFLAWNNPALKEKFTLATGRKILGRGVLTHVRMGDNENDMKLAFLLESLEILSERIAGNLAQEQIKLPLEQ